MLAARKLQQEESQRSLREQAISALSPDEQTIARLDPSALGEIYKTRLGIGGKGQAQLMSTAEAESLGLSPNVRYQRLPDGKIIAVEGTQAVKPEKEEKPTLQEADRYAASMFGKRFYDLTQDEQRKVNARLEELGLQKAEAGVPKPPSRQPSFTDATDLRKEFRATPEFKAFQELKAAYSTVENASKLKTPVADVALATKIMKLLDPGSVVRESELAIAMGAAAPLDRILGYAERLKTGQKLTDTQREEFRILAKRVFDAATQSFDQTKNYYAGVARRGGLDPDWAAALIRLPSKPSSSRDRKSTRLNSSHSAKSRMPSSA